MGAYFFKMLFSLKLNSMKNNYSLNVFRKCADACKACAAYLKNNPEMEFCVRLCRICAARCEQVIMYHETNAAVYENCAEACKSCIEECKKYLNEYCRACVETCSACEEECLHMVE